MKRRLWQGIAVTAGCALAFAGPAVAADGNPNGSGSMKIADGTTMQSAQMPNAKPTTGSTMSMDDGTTMPSSEMPSPTPTTDGTMTMADGSSMESSQMAKPTRTATMDPSMPGMPGMEGSSDVMPSIATPSGPARQRVLAGFALLNAGVLAAAAFVRRSRRGRLAATRNASTGATR